MKPAIKEEKVISLEKYSKFKTFDSNIPTRITKKRNVNKTMLDHRTDLVLK